jgi:uncharacterized protein (TIGR02145 family)
MKSVILYTSLVFMVIFAASCGKEDEPKPIVYEYGIVNDVNGKEYKTIKIGEQWWMLEDLKVDKYKNGDLIIKKDNNTDWMKDTLGSYAVNNGNYYYNWYTVNNLKDVAPEGWHIPSDEEWKKLEIHIGMNANVANLTLWRGNDEGDKLKDAKLNVWSRDARIYATNESGFTALPNNCRLEDGTFGSPVGSSQGFWWSSTSHNTKEAWFRNLDYKKSNILRLSISNNYGFCVRCVKD